MQTSDTLAYLISQGFSTTILERFWSKVDKSGSAPSHGQGPCWVWTAYTIQRGYGRMYMSAVGPNLVKQILSHRLSWIIHFGPIPEGLKVLHSCDNPPCVRPDHLFLGTQQQNIQDMVIKDRQARGEKKWKCRLTPTQIEEIRIIGRTMTQKEIGLKFHTDPGNICRILNSKAWRHIKTV